MTGFIIFGTRPALSLEEGFLSMVLVFTHGSRV
jgi:hypothetical protein